jgi:hypothetical protein
VYALATMRGRTRLIPLSALLLSLVGCPSQNEGERCNIENGNDDCAEGLVCKSSRDLGGNADICCPDGASENPECIPGSGGTSTASSSVSSTSATNGAGGDTSGATGTSSSGGAGQGGAGGSGGAGGGGGASTTSASTGAQGGMGVGGQGGI